MEGGAKSIEKCVRGVTTFDLRLIHEEGRVFLTRGTNVSPRNFRDVDVYGTRLVKLSLNIHGTELILLLLTDLYSLS